MAQVVMALENVGRGHIRPVHARAMGKDSPQYVFFNPPLHSLKPRAYSRLLRHLQPRAARRHLHILPSTPRIPTRANNLLPMRHQQRRPPRLYNEPALRVGSLSSKSSCPDSASFSDVSGHSLFYLHHVAPLERGSLSPRATIETFGIPFRFLFAPPTVGGIQNTWTIPDDTEMSITLFLAQEGERKEWLHGGGGYYYPLGRGILTRVSF